MIRSPKTILVIYFLGPVLCCGLATIRVLWDGRFFEDLWALAAQGVAHATCIRSPCSGDLRGLDRNRLLIICSTTIVHSLVMMMVMGEESVEEGGDDDDDDAYVYDDGNYDDDDDGDCNMNATVMIMLLLRLLEY